MNNDLLKALERMKEYVDYYPELVDSDQFYESEFVRDMLYAIGTAVSDRYKYVNGFEQFKIQHIMPVLHDMNVDMLPCPFCDSTEHLEEFYWSGCKKRLF